MLTYTPPDQRKPAKTHEKPWLLLLMAFAWLWPGVFSHGLWNPAEPQVFTAIEALKNGSSPLVANILGQIDFSISPLYLWLAALCHQLLYPWATESYAAARFASVIFTVIGLTCSGFAGFNFLGRHHGRSVVLILMGCVGLLSMSHFIGDMSVQFAAISMVLCGFSFADKRVIISALLLGMGWAMLSVSGGFLLTATPILLALLLTLHPQWRFKRYTLTLIGAFSVAIPLMVVYPFLLLKTQPQWFAIWLNHHIFGAFGGMAEIQVAFSLPYYLKNLLWFAFPAWPLAIWTYTRTQMSQHRWSVLGMAWLWVMLIVLAVIPQRFQENLIGLLPILALIGAAKLDSLRRGAAAFLNWFGIMAFGLLATFLWIGFGAMNYGFPAKLAEHAAYFSPYYTPHIRIIPMVVAILFTPLWLWCITRKNIRGRQAVTNWAAGVTFTWALLMTLFLPWLDAIKSHAPVVHQMEAALSPELKQQLSDGMACISVAHTDYHTRMIWTQYSTLKLHIDDASCAYRLTSRSQHTADAQDWTQIWQGSRPRNKVERFSLQQRVNL